MAPSDFERLKMIVMSAESTDDIAGFHTKDIMHVANEVVSTLLTRDPGQFMPEPLSPGQMHTLRISILSVWCHAFSVGALAQKLEGNK